MWRLELEALGDEKNMCFNIDELYNANQYGCIYGEKLSNISKDEYNMLLETVNGVALRAGGYDTCSLKLNMQGTIKDLIMLDKNRASVNDTVAVVLVGMDKNNRLFSTGIMGNNVQNSDEELQVSKRDKMLKKVGENERILLKNMLNLLTPWWYSAYKIICLPKERFNGALVDAWVETGGCMTFMAAIR